VRDHIPSNCRSCSVGRGLARLKAAGVLNWLRRCVATGGGFLMRQISNAYAALCSQWRGYRPPPAPPPPAPGTWGDHPPIGSALDVAAALGREGVSLQRREGVRALSLARSSLPPSAADAFRSLGRASSTWEAIRETRVRFTAAISMPKAFRLAISGQRFVAVTDSTPIRHYALRGASHDSGTRINLRA
jgi:hypothetical protein